MNAATVIEGSLDINNVTTVQGQYIYPELQFTCNGIIEKWIFGAKTNDQAEKPELQIWRQTGPDTYTKQGASLVTANETASPNVHEYYPETPLQFQQGDVLGIYYPTESDPQLYVQEGNGPLNIVPVTSTNTRRSEIHTSQIQTQMYNYFPLVSPVVCKYTNTTHIQWNPSIPDTIGTTVSVLIIEVSLFQRLIYTHVCIWDKTKCPD